MRRNLCCTCIAENSCESIWRVTMIFSSYFQEEKVKFFQYPLYFPTSYLHFGLNNTDFSLHFFMSSNQVFHTFHIFSIVQCLYQYTLERTVGCENGEDNTKQKDLYLNYFKKLPPTPLCIAIKMFLLSFWISVDHIVCSLYRDEIRIHISFEHS